MFRNALTAVGLFAAAKTAAGTLMQKAEEINVGTLFETGMHLLHHTTGHNGTDVTPSTDEGLSANSIAGIVIGSLVAATIVGIGIHYTVTKNRKKSRNEEFSETSSVGLLPSSMGLSNGNV